MHLVEQNDKDEWNLLLNFLSNACNSAIYAKAGFSLGKLFFGRRLRIPVDMLYGKDTYSKFYASEEMALSLLIQ